MEIYALRAELVDLCSCKCTRLNLLSYSYLVLTFFADILTELYLAFQKTLGSICDFIVIFCK